MMRSRYHSRNHVEKTKYGRTTLLAYSMSSCTWQVGAQMSERSETPHPTGNPTRPWCQRGVPSNVFNLPRILPRRAPDISLDSDEVEIKSTIK